MYDNISFVIIVVQKMNNDTRCRVVTLLYGKILHMEVETGKNQAICSDEKLINVVTTHICFCHICHWKLKKKKGSNHRN